MQIHSEDEFLKLISTYFPNKNMLVGRGDDCAVVNWPEKVCISTDLFVEDIHFRHDYFTAADIGYKSLAVNISDIAGMGGNPLGFSLALACPPSLGIDFWEPFLSSMSRLADDFNLTLTGGDLSRADKLTISITVWGACSQNCLQRQKCVPQDLIFIVGDIGLARAGLMLLEGQTSVKNFPMACQAHLHPYPQVRAGQVLAQNFQVSSLMDLSDGLARDLPRLLGSDKGACLEINDSHLQPELQKYCRQNNQDPVEFAMQGGEDYALLGTIKAQGLQQIQAKVPRLKIIGKVMDSPVFTLNHKQVKLQGFDHFGKENV